MSYAIVPLGKKHRKKVFDCGNDKLNIYLQATAKQHIEKDIARTWVLIDKATPTNILGFYTSIICTIESNELPVSIRKKYPKGMAMPSIKLARLGISTLYKKQGFGKVLVNNFLERVSKLSEDAGLVVVLVDAKDEDLIPYYERLGFGVLQDLTLFMTVKAIPPYCI